MVACPCPGGVGRACGCVRAVPPPAHTGDFVIISQDSGTADVPGPSAVPAAVLASGGPDAGPVGSGGCRTPAVSDSAGGAGGGVAASAGGTRAVDAAPSFIYSVEHVLYKEQVKHLKALGLWAFPDAASRSADDSGGASASVLPGQLPPSDSEEGSGTSSDGSDS